MLKKIYWLTFRQPNGANMSGLNELSDRDLLIKCATNIDNLCAKFEQNEKEHAEIFRELRKKVPMSLFFFVVAIIVSCLLGLAAYSGDTKEDVIKNTTCIERMGDKNG